MVIHVQKGHCEASFFRKAPLTLTNCFDAAHMKIMQANVHGVFVIFWMAQETLSELQCLALISDPEISWAKRSGVFEIAIVLAYIVGVNWSGWDVLIRCFFSFVLFILVVLFLFLLRLSMKDKLDQQHIERIKMK